MGDDLRAIAEQVSCSAICDALMRRHVHRAHIVDLVSPAPERWMLGPVVTMQFMPLRADLIDPDVHDFSAMLDRAVAGRDPGAACWRSRAGGTRTSRWRAARS